MTIIINGSTGITNDSGYTGDGVSFADSTPSNTLVFISNNAERMRIDSSGNLLVGTTNSGNSGAGVQLWNYTGTVGSSIIKKTQSGTFDAISFCYSGAQKGSVTYSDTAVAFNTTSDYRLKENIAPMTGALATVSALKPVTYKWKIDGSDGQGFIAHELQAVVPDCVTGEKDGVETYTDEDGVEQTRPKYQGIDTSFLVATLTCAIQELKAELDTVKAELATLKGTV